MSTLGNRTPPIVAMPGFRPPGWLVLCTASLIFGATAHAAHAQVRGGDEADGADRTPPIMAPRGPPRIGRPAGVREPRTNAPPAGEGRYVSDEVLVEVMGQPPGPAMDALAARHRLTFLQSHTVVLTNTTWFRWRIADDRPVAKVVRALEAERFIRSAQPNYLFTLP
jgi:hypothetical protein